MTSAAHHFISSAEPFFELIAIPNSIATPKTTETEESRMHYGMTDSMKTKYEHAQANETTAAVHSLTVDEFIQKQERQSMNWLKQYTTQLNENKALSANFVFGRATPIENAAERSDTAFAILKNSS